LTSRCHSVHGRCIFDQLHPKASAFGAHLS
jgi:hypothetical protein